MKFSNSLAERTAVLLGILPIYVFSVHNAQLRAVRMPRIHNIQKKMSRPTEERFVLYKNMHTASRTFARTVPHMGKKALTQAFGHKYVMLER